MLWIPSIIVGLIAGPLMSNWFGVFSFGLGVALFAGVVTAIRGPAWEQALDRGTKPEQERAKEFIEGERQRYGSDAQFSRGQLFLFEFILSGGLFLGAAAVSRFIFV